MIGCVYTSLNLGQNEFIFFTVVDRFRNCFRDVIYLISQKAPYINRTSCLDIGVRDVSMVDAWFSVCPSSDLIQII